MTQSEQICRQLILKKKWTRMQCYLCRRIKKDICTVLKGMAKEVENAKV